MTRQTILMIWIGGAVLAVALYLTDPDRFLAACLDLIDLADAAFHTMLFALGTQVANVVRAAAIAVYVVFVVLAVMAAWRGLGGGWALVVVTVAVPPLASVRTSLPSLIAAERSSPSTVLSIALPPPARIIERSLVES